MQSPTIEGHTKLHNQDHNISKSNNHSSDTAVDIPINMGPTRSIYDTYSNRRRYLILLAAAVATVLVPFTDTIFLPALAAVGRDLQTSRDFVAASVGIYMFTVGLGSLVWGPAADKFGRKMAYAATTVLFIGTSFACIFAPSIGTLVAFRALQGLAVASFGTTGQGVIADVFPAHMRSTASGIYMIPVVVGPILGPLLGGVLSQQYGWRSTFICLVVLCGGLVAPLLALLVPETQQFRVIQKHVKADPAAAKLIVEAESILAHPSVFAAPWVPLRYLFESTIFPYALLTMSSFGVMSASLTEWPGRMAAEPYNLSESIIGVSYVAMGAAGFLGSPIGGKVSDITAARLPQPPQGRLIVNVAVVLVFLPVGLLLSA